MKTYTYILIAVMTTFVSCKDFLDEKPRKSLAVPTTLRDFQALLEKQEESQQDAKWGEISSTDFYYDDAVLASKNDVERSVYLWDNPNAFGTTRDADWLSHYTFIYHTNTVLDGLTKTERNNQNSDQWDKIKGEALFFRAKCHLSIANIWAKGYNKSTANTDLGIPLRLTIDFNEVSFRSSILETYSQIISDLKNAIPLLPVAPSNVVRPSKPAAMALLARVYLFMGDYTECFKYADACLNLKNDLIDFNDLSPSANYPFVMFNKEVIYHSYMSTSLSNSKMSGDLIALYNDDDLRKALFFKNNNNGTFSFKGSYQGSATLFAGIGTDEIYLMRAECYARGGELQLAMNDINTLVKKRWKKDKIFVPFSATSEPLAIAMILTERRKELLLRGIRWPDIKRLNIMDSNITLKRLNNGKESILLPNDNRFALPIPEAVIRLTGMQQNPK